MTTPTSKHLDYLDGWRGLAISLLLIGHFFPVPGINLGTLGVNFFFVLSGWLMTRLLFIQDTPINVFYRRRISRIIPAHIAFVLLIVIGYGLFGRPVSGPESFAAALFVNNYIGSAPRQSIMPFGHIWSLSVEEHSYVLLSVLAIASRKGLVSPIVGLGGITLVCAAFAIGYSLYYPAPALQFDKWLHTEVAGYAIFVSGFILLLMRKSGQKKWPTLVVPVLIAIGVVLHWWSVPLAVQKIVGVGALALAVNLLPQAPTLLQSALSWRPLRYLGLWSFSLYVWQQPFYLWSRGGHAPTWIGLLCAILAGLTSYYLLEQPARRYLNRTWGRKKLAPTPA